MQEFGKKEPKEIARVLKLSQRGAKKILLEARDMLQGTLLEPELLQRGVRHANNSPPTLALPLKGGGRNAETSFKAQVLDLVAQRFR